MSVLLLAANAPSSRPRSEAVKATKIRLTGRYGDAHPHVDICTGAVIGGVLACDVITFVMDGFRISRERRQVLAPLPADVQELRMCTCPPCVVEQPIYACGFSAH